MATTLKGNDVYSSLTVGDQQLEYGGSRAGQFYFLISAGDRNGTCSPEFRDLFKAGKLHQVTYSETDYQPMDRTDPTKVRLGADGQPMPKRKSISLGGYTTKEQMVNVMKGDKALVQAEAELKVAGKVAERQAYVEAGIEKDEMIQLMALA